MVRKRVRRGRLAVVLLVLAALLSLAGVILWARDWYHAPGPGAETVVEITRGESIARLADALEAAGVVTHPRVLVIAARVSGLASRVRAGEYRIDARLSPAEVLALFASGRVLLHPVTLVEGWTVATVLETLRSAPFITPQLPPTVGDDARLSAALGLKTVPTEGLYAPDTYLVPKGTTEVEVLKLAHERLESLLAGLWSARAPNLPLGSSYEALVLASLIEKETAAPEERAHIAAVFINRLRRGIRLQTDPSVIYGLGRRYTGALHHPDLTTDTPYNTYTRAGLPPTPIALPSRASLEAALHPAKSDDLYFVASGEGDGRHRFSATLAAHNKAVARYVARRHAQQGAR